jgi:outer membrane lipoprotein-sorting protein
VRRLTHTAVINEDTVDTGTVLIKRKKPHDVEMLLDIKEPDPKQLLVDTHKVLMYFPKLLTVQEYDLSKYKSMVEQGLLLSFASSSKELAGSYTISLGEPETVSGEKTTRIELIPKSSEMLSHLRRVDLWISDTTGLAVQQKFFQAADYQLVTYSNIKTNPNLPDPKLNLPKGVKHEYPQK